MRLAGLVQDRVVLRRLAVDATCKSPAGPGSHVLELTRRQIEDPLPGKLAPQPPTTATHSGVPLLALGGGKSGSKLESGPAQDRVGETFAAKGYRRHDPLRRTLLAAA